ncbi:MAG: ABC transporter substrate-binding protein [Ardenticatenaceae bacterium]|nr:ABC transporter substrate-binding protein [Ardenticatenaceae bacterium]
MKRATILPVIVVLALIMVACGGGTTPAPAEPAAPTATTAAAAEPAPAATATTAPAPTEAAAATKPAQMQTVKLVVGDGVGNPLGHVQAISKAKGFSEPGLEIEWKRFPSGAAQVEALASGDLQVGIAGDTPAMALISGGTPAKIVSKQTDPSRGYAVYARQDANVQKPEDLYGKTVGFTFGSQASALWANVLGAYNLDASKMKTIDLSPPDLVASYERGDIEVFAIWQPYGYRLSQIRPTVKLHDPYTSYFPSAPGPKRLGGYYTVIIARDEVIRNQPEALKAFLRLVDRTNKFITENPAEAVQIISENIKADPEGQKVTIEQIEHTMVVDDLFLQDLESQANFLFKQGRLRNAPKPGLQGWYDFSLLKEVFPEYVKVTQ